MTGRWARAVTLLLGVATATVACSGSDGPTPASPLESAEPITAPPTTDAGPASTEAPEVTEPPTTTSSTTTTTTTTEPAPTTTTLDDLRAEIEADLNEGEQALIAGGGNPTSEESVQRLSDFFAGPALATVTAIYERLASEGLVARPNPEIQSEYKVTAVLESSASSASILTCRVDAGLTFRVDSTGAEQIENDTVVVYTSENLVTLDGDTWKLTDGETLTRIENETSC
ncbi:NAD(P)H-binding domain containing protein [Ilumatobacter coccineus]|uniref:Uncharacterized protein n=1 Tax=Ilumatobacter coccineus (strain NBRC 103263 / KCTC 29153 / YM16-304) TaxID=1313172 RepID=A0A6C7EFH0_ILUCY|nr:hypothetical protein [Ilumatobacter coccineus]BAN03919.1 hypothetical protein YM304_36050 [Ilumatobacter coccineus YM16-304]